MAQRVITKLIDDLDGGKADETISFGLDGRYYEIDLSADHAEDLRSALEAFVKAGRKQGTAKAAKNTTTRSAASREDTAAIREWAKAQGLKVNDRGRIALEIANAYRNRNTAPKADQSDKKDSGVANPFSVRDE
ncbi:histone-like nucleoid-structuring protein Lsr2 [Nocardiopsis ansamitocini]|uniref:Lsr2 family protein n=1 Tax=Nocardiopsis ansamitocini TaxID=1670832 RepID=A0A9W6UJS4_9ACTN|nr:Lsr2 family protein [Nocardiopsis ansamitocini]